MIAFLKSLYRWSFQTAIGRVLSAVTAIAVWVLIWHTAAVNLSEPLLLPTPVSVARRLLALAGTADFWQHSAFSLLRVLGGILIGTALAILTAVLTASLPPLHALLRPLIAVIKSTPVASFIILIMLWAHEDVLPVVVCTLMIFPVVWANVHAGLQNVPRPYREMARVFRLPLGRRIRRIYVPSALPYFLSACESSLGLAWKAGVAAEVLAPATKSIGRHLYESKLYILTEDMFAWTLAVVLFSVLLEKLTKYAFRRLKAKRERALLGDANEGKEDDDASLA